MKLLSIVILFSISSSFSFAQTKKIDSLITLIHNDDIIEDGNYAGPTTMITGTAAWELMQIGKTVCPQLMAALADSSKGIIAHYILTYLTALPVKAEQFIYNERDRISTVLFNGLYFFIKQKKFIPTRTFYGKTNSGGSFI
jgi:hypothetical protein